MSIFLVAALLSLPGIGYGLLASEDQLIRFFPDDAFYYLKTASNWVRTGRITFDGVHPTNGFHPLYFLVVSFLSMFFKAGDLLRATFALNHVLLQLSTASVVRAARGLMPVPVQIALLSAVSLPVHFGCVVISSGLEASAVVLCTMLLFVALQQAVERRFASTPHNLLLGTALTLWMMTRLDLVVGIPFVAGYVVWTFRSAPQAGQVSKWISHPGAAFALPLLVGSVYLGFNYHTTGYLLPINGFVKTFSSVSFLTSWAAATQGGGARGFIVGVFPLAASLGMLSWIAHQKRTRSAISSWLSALVPINLANVAFYVYLVGYARNFFCWYLAFPAACLALDVVVATAAGWSRFQQLRSASRRILVAIAVLGVAVNVVANIGFVRWMGDHPLAISFHLKQIAALVNRFADEDSVTGVFDAGIVAYYARGRVINLDGLANSYDYYLNYYQKQRLLEYFRLVGVTHLLVRDAVLGNAREVADNSYREAVFLPDQRLALRREDERFRYNIPGHFSVYLFDVSARR